MLSKQENEMMCLVEAGTPMGTAMRRFWIPAMHSRDLPPPDGDPKHVELLGDHFVVFRDTAGNIGFMDESCCHRGASLLLGRVEQGGIRCPYHGWKFAADGTVLETPNISDQRFKDRFKAVTYPIRDAGGLLWVYLGPIAQQPEFPKWPFLSLPEKNRINASVVANCNYVQIMEGLLDSTHLSVLHSGQLAAGNNSDLKFAQVTNHMQFDTAPRLEVEDTEFGFHYAALRDIAGKDGSRRTETMIAAFTPPFFVCNPQPDLWFAVVPVNSKKSIFYHVWGNPAKDIGVEPDRNKLLSFIGLDQPTLEVYGMTLETCNGPNAMQRDNYFRKDLEQARKGHFTGLKSFTQEDAAVSISSGLIRDRSREKLCTADAAISRMYRILLICAKQAVEGHAPLGLNAPTDRITGNHGTLPPGGNWRSFVPNHVAVNRTAQADEEIQRSA